MSHGTGLMVLVALVASACGTGPDDSSVAGTWRGVASLPATSTTNLSLTQSGNTVGGTIDISGILTSAIVGTFSASARTVDWLVFAGCEQWTGLFTISSDGSEMSGPVEGDFSSCASGSDISGTISVSRQ